MDVRRAMLAAAAIGTAILGATPALAASTRVVRARRAGTAAETQTAGARQAGVTAKTRIVNARRASVTAELTHSGSYPHFKETLTITVHGRVAYHRPISQKRCEGVCGPLPGRASLRIARLQRGGPPDVVLSFSTFGSDCCTIDQIVYPRHGRWTVATHNFGPGPARTTRRHGRDYLVGGDRSFAGRFGPMVAIALPIQVLRFSDGHFHNLTRRFPRLISADARRWLAAFKLQSKQAGPADGAAIAAWAADEDSLGHRRRVARYLAAQAKHGRLDAGHGFGGDGRHFIAELDAFLRRHGYLR